MFICLVRQCLSTRYGQLITTCSSFVQCLSTLVLQYSVQTLTTACLFLSTLVLLYSVQTTHHGVFFICLVPQQVNTVVLSTACSSFVWCASMLVPQYSLQTLTTACLFAQQVSTLVLGMDNSSRRVLHLFSALVPQYLSTVILGTDIHHGMFISEYVSTVVLGSACSSFVWCASTLVLYYSIRTTHHVFFFICLVPQYVSTVVFATGTHHGMLSALVRQYCSTWSEQPITACCSFVQRANSLVPQYSVRTTYHGLLLFSARVLSTLVLGRDDSSYQLTFFLTDYFIDE